jgi:hypothetical protein
MFADIDRVNAEIFLFWANLAFAPIQIAAGLATTGRRENAAEFDR